MGQTKEHLGHNRGAHSVPILWRQTTDYPGNGRGVYGDVIQQKSNKILSDMKLETTTR